MSPFEQYLISIGYIRYRKIYDKKNGWNYVESNEGYSFSTMEPGGLNYYYKMGGKEIIFGLNEHRKPPTLCYPRPIGTVFDDDMNRILKEKTSEEIYKLLPL